MSKQVESAPSADSNICGSVRFGHGFSFWITLILIVAGTVLTFLRKDAPE
ncbi:MAG: hypothetical protein ACRDPG_10350 [Nocardioidaceae bacterium]